MKLSMLFHQDIQVAGVIDEAEARLLLSCGVRYLGFPLRLPVHREDLSEAEATRLIAAIQPDACGVLITYLSRTEEVIALARYLGVTLVQLHGEIELGELRKLTEAAPELRLIKSLVVGVDDQALETSVQELSPLVDAFITDTYDPRTGATGATGKVHDWNVSRRLVERSPRPVILAGGLTPENVREAIGFVAPAGVDAHTGVEGADGRKSREKVLRFMAEARAGFAGLARQKP